MELIPEVKHKLENMIFGYIDELQEYLLEPHDSEAWDEDEDHNRLPLGHLEYEENITEREELLFYEVLNCYDFSITELNMLLVYIKKNSNYFNIKYSNYDAVFEDGDLTNNDNYDNGYGNYSFLRDVTTIFYENNKQLFLEYLGLAGDLK
jgi:hypothetical protein